MNLSDFSRYIDPAVVHRGKEYASEGRVISLKSIADEKYTAVVRGYEDYEVYVRLDNENNIMESECDCPYDFGPVCKHQVAVFLELKNREADGVSSPEPSLRQLLEAESQGEINRIAALDCIGFIYRGRAHQTPLVEKGRGSGVGRLPTVDSILH